MSEELLTLDSVEAKIGGSLILRGVSFSVKPNEVHALMGRNGVGKTTTLRAIMGERPLSVGRLTLLGKDITKLSSGARARLGIGYVPQGRDIFPQLTIKENLYAGLTVKKRSRSEMKEALDKVYTLFPVLYEMSSRNGGVLSGGQQQQLAIGRALLTDPKILILDEPTEGIQPSIIDQIGDTLKMLKNEGSMSILLIEQYVDFCREIADRFSIMDRGKVTASGEIKELTDEVVHDHLEV